MAQRFLTLILLLCSVSFAGLFDAAAQLYPCRPGVRFRFPQNQHDQPHLAGERGYYLYRKQVSTPPGKRGALQMPAGEWHEDEFYGKSEIYRQRQACPSR
jgi:thiol:disulfide interchange protein DsbD